MAKFFVCSDIHSYFHIFYEELIRKGYDINNPDHYIICCGDFFDRGPEPLATYNFFTNTPRVILIRGNHEDLLESCLERGFWMDHDAHNGTIATVLAFGQRNPKDIEKFHEACAIARPKVKWFLDFTINYFETKNYIFTHGWIPCREDLKPTYWQEGISYIYKPDWRDAHASEWNNARWINGMKAWRDRAIEPGKTIVCGHWHTSWGHSRYEHHGSEFEANADFSPFKADGILAIDACTAYTEKVNIVVIEDEFMEGVEI